AAASKPVAHPAPNLCPLVRGLRAIVEVRVLRTGAEIDRDDGDAEHEQAVDYTAADTAVDNDDKLGVVGGEGGCDLRGELHGVEALMDFDLAASAVRSAARVDDGGVIAEPAYVNAEAHAVSGAEHVGAFRCLASEFVRDEGLGVDTGEEPP